MRNNITPTIRTDENTDYISTQIQAQVVKTEKLEKSPFVYIHLLDVDVDKSSLYSFTAGIVLVYFIWKYLGLFSLFETHKFVAIIFIAQIVLFIAQIFTSSTKVASYNMESNMLIGIDQINSVLLGTIILYSVFAQDTNAYENKLIYSNIIISCIFLIHISIPRDANNIRSLRKVKQVGLNIVLFLFVIILHIHIHPSYET